MGCFLTGHNYRIIEGSSEVAAKAVKRYASALLIVSILWAFIGFTFTRRYLHGGLTGSIVGAVIMVVIIVQIERQIILSITPSRWLYFFRGVIACMMAILGAIIIDQIIFKEDIELEQITLIDQKVKKALPERTIELQTQIKNIDSTIAVKETDRRTLVDDITKNPTIRTVTSQNLPVALTSSKTDSLKNTLTTSRIVNTNSTTINSIQNPKFAMLGPLDQQISSLRFQKNEKDSMLLSLQSDLKKELQSKVGFLDELKVMYSLIANSNIALAIWFLWFFFLLGLEMFVLISKIGEKRNDYEETIMHQMNLQTKKLQALAKQAESK